MTSISQRLAGWAAPLTFADVPADVIETTKLRILDVIGLAIAGSQTPFGKAVLEAADAMGPGPGAAAFRTGALAQALEYDDTHNESVVHISAPSVGAALALADQTGASGKEVLTAIALGSEIACRIGVVSPGQMHKRGFHPTGLFSTFGCAYLAGRMLGLGAPAMANAAGIAGSFASGLLQCWVDGTQSKFLHPGWAAQSGIAAALLARAGATGPAEILEGRFGLFASHIQDPDVPKDFVRITKDLGEHWESRSASFKPMPAAHVIHPYVDALLRLKARHGIEPEAVEEIVCPVAAYIVPIVCEPLDEKRRPRTDSHGRVSLPYTLAEALALGRLGKDAYADASRADPAILALADRIRHQDDPDFPGPERFKGVVRVRLKDGRTFEEVEEHNRGSAANPLPDGDILAKFAENAGPRPDLVEAVMSLDRAPDARALTAGTDW